MYQANHVGIIELFSHKCKIVSDNFTVKVIYNVCNCIFTPFKLILKNLAECWPAKAGGKHGTISAPALFHAGFRAADQSRLTTVSRLNSARVDSADVWCQEHDGGLWSQARPLSHRGSGIPWQDVNEGGWRTNVECSKQKQVCWFEFLMSLFFTLSVDQEPFFHMLGFGVLEKDSAWIE